MAELFQVGLLSDRGLASAVWVLDEVLFENGRSSTGCSCFSQTRWASCM